MPAGEIIGLPYQYDPYGPDWYDLLAGAPVPQVASGDVLHLAVSWKNLGTVRSKGHIDFVAIMPNLSTVLLTAKSGQDTFLLPNNAISVFYDLTPAVEGTYRATIILGMEDEAPTQGIDLYALWNLVSYSGPTAWCADVFASIVAYCPVVTVDRGGITWYYYPQDPGPSTFNTIYQGEIIWIYVTQACRWTW